MSDSSINLETPNSPPIVVSAIVGFTSLRLSLNLGSASSNTGLSKKPTSLLTISLNSNSE
ncbi:MAG: hypothetical protein CBC24_08875 [Candidatus Pelagibacter sp. TMED64]|nr:MAG: hypothetical protein CBC24_08875 [Candidatus Pelagibacter sp. TMED64]